MSPPLKIVPCALSQANAYVARLHRHNSTTKSGRFAVGLAGEDGVVHGVGIAGTPLAVSEMATPGVIEILRVCTDGTPNACSMIYGALRRAAVALGYHRVITFTLVTEPGTSLRAAGFREAGINAESPNWNRGRKFAKKGNITQYGQPKPPVFHGTMADVPKEPKRRWEWVREGQPLPEVTWPAGTTGPQTLFG